MLGRGASAEEKLKASLAYDFSQPGTYHIEFRGPIMDVATQQVHLLYPFASHNAVRVQCPAAETTVVAS